VTSHDSRVQLQTLAIRDFRNLERLELRFPSSGVVVVGDNGQGKSNLLEAIYYLHLLRSVRGARDVDVVRFGAPGFHLAATSTGGAHRELNAGFVRQGRRKRVKLEGVEPQRLSDALGALPCVLFSPADVELIAGAPSARRRYLDILLALSSRPYLFALQRYRHALAQRNAALRDAVRSAGSKAEQRIAVWEQPLAEHGAVLWLERVTWADRIESRFAEMVASIGEQTPVSLRHASALEPASRALPDVASALARGLEERRAARTATISRCSSADASFVRSAPRDSSAPRPSRSGSSNPRRCASGSERRRCFCSTIPSPSSTFDARRASSSCLVSARWGRRSSRYRARATFLPRSRRSRAGGSATAS
jgi:DNA replication and repair protein RecF